ncbi:hypothetical protein SY88_00135 [Clostridiales bacterium PH28_bin88]|nr:hypothetical protein SY88_00135 [Clostridiales bacterium PH28_bin88]
MHSSPIAEISTKNMLRQLLRYVPGSLLPAVVSVVSAAVFTRVFQASAYGQYVLVTSVTSLLAVVLSQWLQQSTNRFLPQAMQEESTELVKGVIVRGLWLITMAILAGTFFLWLVLRRHGWDASLLVSGAAVLLVTCLAGTTLAALQAQMLAKQYSLFRVLESVLRLAITLALVFFVARTPLALLWGHALSTGVLLVPLWLAAGLKPRTPGSAFWPTSKERNVLKIFLAYGVPFTGWFFAANLLDVGDRYVLHWLRSSAEVGIYAANYTLISGAVGVLVSPVHLAAYPSMMHAWAKGDRKQVARAIGTIVEVLLVSGILLVGFVYIYSLDLARILLGPEFREGYIIMPVVLAGFVAWQVGMYTHKPLELYNKTGLMMIVGLAAAGINVLLNLIIVRWYGYIGAAYTTFFSYFLYAVIIGVSCWKYVPWTFPTKALISSTTVVIIATVTAVSARNLLVGHGWLLGAVGAGVVYLVIALGGVLWLERDKMRLVWRALHESHLGVE